MTDPAPYPSRPAERDRFVMQRRRARPPLDPWRHQGVVLEDEPSPHGGRDRVATVFLTGRECPWRCAMCDLWQYTTTSDTPPGAIPAQIARARAEIGRESFTAIKLYNAGSFFDPRAVPERDYPAIASTLTGLSRVIVECHPSLVGAPVDRFQVDLQTVGIGAPALEVAMGLETAHPQALERLNKRFTLADFSGAARALRERGIAVRVFLLIAPPFVPAADQDTWLRRSIDAAFESGAAIVSLVPTRAGNGTIETLAAGGLFVEPALATIERSFEIAMTHGVGRGLVLLDLWDLDRFAPGGRCRPELRARLEAMNQRQTAAA
jgi:radical SAM enzyme (TIGR01210 family)